MTRPDAAIPAFFEKIWVFLDFSRKHSYEYTYFNYAKDARLFIQFLALIFMNEIRKTTAGDKVLWHLTVRETMDEMETLCRITYANRRGQLLTETNKLQRRIVEVFGVKLPAN